MFLVPFGVLRLLGFAIIVLVKIFGVAQKLWPGVSLCEKLSRLPSTDLGHPLRWLLNFRCDFGGFCLAAQNGHDAWRVVAPLEPLGGTLRIQNLVVFLLLSDLLLLITLDNEHVHSRVSEAHLWDA